MDIEKNMQFILDTQAKLWASQQKSDERLGETRSLLRDLAETTSSIAPLTEENSKQIAENSQQIAENQKAIAESRRLATEREEQNQREHQDFMDRANLTIKMIDEMIRRRENGAGPA